jgi:hypothetical protein
MPRIKVTKPFKVRFAPGKAMREFTEGLHELTQAELDNWFVQGCIEQDRAMIVPDAKPEAKPAAEAAPDPKAKAKKAPAKTGKGKK